jgi:hypothetical protein
MRHDQPRQDMSTVTSRAHEALPSAPKLIHKSMRPSSAGASGAKPGSGWYTLWRGELKSTPGQYRTPACPYEPSLTSSIPRSNQVESASNANSFLPVLPLLCRTDSPILRPRNPTQQPPALNLSLPRLVIILNSRRLNSSSPSSLPLQQRRLPPSTNAIRPSLPTRTSYDTPLLPNDPLPIASLSPLKRSTPSSPESIRPARSSSPLPSQTALSPFPHVSASHIPTRCSPLPTLSVSCRLRPTIDPTSPPPTRSKLFRRAYSLLMVRGQGVRARRSIRYINERIEESSYRCQGGRSRLLYTGSEGRTSSTSRPFSSSLRSSTLGPEHLSSPNLLCQLQPSRNPFYSSSRFPPSHLISPSIPPRRHLASPPLIPLLNHPSLLAQ